MKPRPRIWETESYSRSRRKHAHRCKCCQRIMREGEAALFYRHARGCWVVHLECADKMAQNIDGKVITWREQFELYAEDANFKMRTYQ